MDNWEIDDESLVKYFEEVESEFDKISVEVDFVPETQHDSLDKSINHERPSVFDNESVGREDAGGQRSGKQICFDYESVDRVHRKCHCGVDCEVVVCRNRKNAGRRFYGCSLFNDHKIQPDCVDTCNFFEWIDPPMCRRGVEYSLEMQAEVSRLEKENSKLVHHIQYLQSLIPRDALFGRNL